ncbi:MAG: aminotransferase class V-fold PLP-dependent enzyme [Deltaproteobacteria bacterium]|nr:aminotransferase class V-fold PLP-dependent enzyme [Deltaproteobacteria bacterium]MBW2151031.1 aminotransferase class V-fold PLP-dependent enzyme [Deltaproteobacteria bacterium]
MPTKTNVPNIFKKLGVTPIIHGSGTTTRYGGTLMRAETIEAMREASQAPVNIDELNEAAGDAIARMLGAEAAIVTGGAAAGLVLQAAACIAGDDPARITRLPDTAGMRNELIIQRAHRFMYDQAFRLAGAELVEIGLGRRTLPYELESAITEKTAAVVYLFAPFSSLPGLLPFETICEIAHKHGVPVIVDAASMLPPRDNLFKHLRQGADLVNFSGGKGIRGPQSTGILAGRKDLIRAAALNNSPNQAVGRPSKTSKEEIVGLVTALELFLAGDEEAEMNHYREISTYIVDALCDLPGIRAVVEQDPFNRLLPTAVIYFEPSWDGRPGHAIREALAEGKPHIYVQQGAQQGGYFDEIAVDPFNLQPGDEEIIARRLREELTRR